MIIVSWPFSLEDVLSHCPVASISAPVEVLQDGGVGSLKQPLLAKRGGVARVHEDSPFTWAAVDTAVTDGVIQTFILEERVVKRTNR